GDTIAVILSYGYSQSEFERIEITEVHKKNERGETPLHVAARRGEHRLCKKLLQEGALVNACDYAGWTPLHEACSHAHFKVAKVLISGGADVNACSESADTPLHDATSNGCEKLVWLLLQSGADRERRNNAGKRPIELCPAECASLRNLLASTTLPERCPSRGDSSPRSPLAAHHLELSTTSPSGKQQQRQPLASPAGTDVTVHSEMCVKGDGRETPLKGDPHGASGKVEEQSLAETTSRACEKANDGVESKEAIGEETDEAKSELQLSDGKVTPSKTDSPPITRRSIWREDKDASSKAEDVSSSLTHAYEFDEEESRESCSRVEDSVEGELRRGGRSRVIGRKERFSSQPPAASPQKPSMNGASEKRKQRGRRRGRGGSTVGGNTSNPPPQSAPVDDVYEFRSSPESDINMSKSLGAADAGTSREMSAPPAAKRQRITQPATDFQQDDVEEVQQDEQYELSGANTVEHTDDKGGASGRKEVVQVPPLRISLPRTPSEDGNAIATGDESNSTSIAANRKRGPKVHAKKQPSPEESALRELDDSAQRVTRSKFRQSGRQLRDHGPPSYDGGNGCGNGNGNGNGNAKRKGGGWRRANTSATNLPSLAPSVTANDESNGADIPEQTQGEEEPSVEESETPVPEDTTPTPMSLMQKNTYEGYRGLRAMIEKRWIEAMALPPPVIPEPPLNYNNYMIINKNYSMGDMDPCPRPKKEDSEEILPAKLRTLREEQERRRHKMEISHKVERERLQMQAETEILRMLTRKANPGRDSLSTVRILHEKEVFNTWFLDVKRPERPVMEDSEVKAKFERLAKLMRNRQQMESDALYAEQVFTWNSAVQKSGDSAQSSLKGSVPRVLVVPLELAL
ncbi:Ankyrin repeat domain-containing protein 12, partial [Toxocara canis]